MVTATWFELKLRTFAFTMKAKTLYSKIQGFGETSMTLI